MRRERAARVPIALAGLAALLPSAARAQDASGLVLLTAPPLLLTPFVAAVARRAGLRRRVARPRPLWAFAGLSVLELALWAASAGLLVLVVFAESWLLLGALVLLLAAIAATNRALAGAGAGWLAVLGSVAVFPVVWGMLQLLFLGVAAWG